MKNLNISIIIPAAGAAPTLAETLESIISQTFFGWEAIIIHDPADQKTNAIVAQFVDQDARIRVLEQPDQGKSAARNVGITHAKFDWLLFLDADDWILPSHLERLTAIATETPQLDVAYCGWARVTSDQKPYGPPQSLTVSGDLFDQLAQGNPFAIHSCVVKRSLVEAVGQFDPSLHTHEDWDLWQRIARTGAYFGGTDEVLALDRIGFRSKRALEITQRWFRLMKTIDEIPFGFSLRRFLHKRAITLAFQAVQVIHSRQGNHHLTILSMFKEAMQVLTQGHTSYPRALMPYAKHAEGKSAERLPALELGLACTYAGLAIGAGEDFHPIFAELPGEYGLDAISMDLLEPFLYALPIPTCHPLSEYHYLWESLEQPINDLAITLEQRLKIPAFAPRARLNMERGILEQAVGSRPVALGVIYATAIEVTQPIPDIFPPSSTERLHCTVQLAGKPLGFLELPILKGKVTSQVLADAIADEFADIIFRQASEAQWQALSRSFKLAKPIEKCSTSSDPATIETCQLPILMYHHIAPTGSSKFTRWRVTPEAFEQQLRYLREAGAYSITLEQWRKALVTKEPLPGKPVLITFDDGYLDFATYAWPLLKRYGFSATVFIVADFVGQTNRWDSCFEYGEALPLLNWRQIKELHDEGVEFGSHTLTHRPLTSLSPAEVLREGSQSREIIERELGVPITSFAYPYGDLDSVVQRLIGRCGYNIAVSCQQGFSSDQDRLLQLSRIEIEGTDPLQEFENKVFPAHSVVALNSAIS
ncbi:MAG: polysaccharide deacetylase family protein [Cyanobacteria bacterium]|jgi:peptidoglycan/xylan/chitin deacetylase (PgdA/CDA1 family)/glycosyltransferase involved in cell wall biosynthesis|nr:polysaccharide deacetylase family protein [Cyanobacteria bacterium GSL.Bin1]